MGASNIFTATNSFTTNAVFGTTSANTVSFNSTSTFAGPSIYNGAITYNGVATYTASPVYSALVSFPGGISVAHGATGNILSGTVNLNTSSSDSTIIAGSASVGSDLTVTGNLTVNGTSGSNFGGKLLNLNTGGASSSGSGVGITVEEASIVTGYIKTGPSRDRWVFLAPNNIKTFSLIPSAANVDLTVPSISGTIALLSDVTGSISGLTPNAVLVTNGSGVLTTSSTVNTTELGYLDGVTSSIQTQLNSMVPITGSVTVHDTKTFDGILRASTAPSGNTDVLRKGDVGSIVDGPGMYNVDTGSVNAYAIATTPSITSYTAGMTVSFLATNTNTAASTITVSAGPTIALKKNTGAALTSGDIVSGSIYKIIYDGTYFRLAAPTPSQIYLSNAVSATGVSYPSFSSTSSHMAGVGLLVTPIKSGAFKLSWVGSSSGAPTTGTDYYVGIAYGLQSAGVPAQGDTLPVGATLLQENFLNSGDNVAAGRPSVASGVVTGLSIGTTYWIDLAARSNGGGTASLHDGVLSAIEV